MAADSARGESKLDKAKLLDGSFEGMVDVGWSDLSGYSRANVVGADGSVVVCGVAHDMCHPPCQSFDWTGCRVWTVVTYALSPFSILLVGDA